MNFPVCAGAGLCLAIILGPLNVVAQDYNWINTMGGDWSDSANWSPTGVPEGGGNSASISGNALMTVTVSGEIELDSVTFDSTFCSLTGGTLITDQGFNWNAGTLAAPLQVEWGGDSTITGVAGTDAKGLSGILINGGTVTWSDPGALVLFDGGRITNNATFDCVGKGTIANSAGTNLFVNNGTLKCDASGTASIQVPLINEGLMDITSGTLSLSSALTCDGSVSISPSGTLYLGGSAQQSFNTGSTVSGNGYVTASSGTATIIGDFTAALNIVSATVNFNGPGTDAPVALNLTGGTLGGSNLVTVPGLMTWSGGYITGTGAIVANGGLNLTGSGLNVYGRMLVNTGVAVWTNTSGSSSLTLNDGAVFSNAPTATFTCLVNGDVSGDQFINEGSFLALGTGTSLMTAPFNNSGTVTIFDGQFDLRSGGINTGAFTVLSGGRLNLSGGSPNFTTNSVLDVLGDFTISGATAELDGPIEDDGTATFSSGTASLAGNASFASLTISGGTANFNEGVDMVSNLTLSTGTSGISGTLGGSNLVTVDSFNWSGGNVSGENSVLINELAVSAGNRVVYLSGRNLFVLTGGTWAGSSGGSITFNGGGLLVLNDATFDCQFDGSMVNTSGANFLFNGGLFRKTGGTGSTTISVPFLNSGTTVVQTATLTLNGSVTNTGTISVSSGANLALAGGTQFYDTNSLVTGAGSVTVSAGTVTMDGDMTSNTLNITGGTINFNGPGMAAPGTLYITNGSLGGSNLVTVSGPMTWKVGTLTGASNIMANGGLTIGNGIGNINLFGRTLVNETNGTWAGSPGGSAINFSGGVLSNAPGATFDCAFDGTMVNDGGTDLFANGGLFRKTGGTGSTTISVPFYNNGTTEVQTATLTLNNVVMSDGTITVFSGANLALGGGTQFYSPSSVVTGAGSVTVSGATVNMAGNLTSNVLNITAGTINFNGTNTAAPAMFNITNGTAGGSNLVTVSGPMKWLAGSIDGTNLILANGGLSLGNGNGNLNLTSRTLVNGANGTWNGSPGGTIAFSGGAVLSNTAAGTFDCTFDGSMINNNGANLIANSGLFRKTGGTNATVIGVPFNNAGTVEVQTGTLYFSGQPYVQTSGATELNGGSISNSLPLRIQGGILQGNGKIGGSVTNAGITYPGATGGVGRTLITGAYTQTTNGALDFEISGTNIGNGFAQLAVSNSAILNGTLNVNFTNGFSPTTNDSFIILTCTNRLGIFSAFNYPSNGYDMTLVYTASNVTLQIAEVYTPTSSIVSLQPGNPGSGSNTLVLSGISGDYYAVQFATNIIGPWMDFNTNLAGTNGNWIVIDPSATNASRFYRVRSF